MPVALITGASSGIGESFALELARRQFGLVLVARREARLREVADEARILGATSAETAVFDLSRGDAPQQLHRRLVAEHTEVDFLINNAGFGTTGRFDHMPLERELEEINLNVLALVALTRLFLPAMIVRHSGTIINVASTAAFQAVPYMLTYAATKAFVLSFTEGLANEVAGSGVRILALCPGPVRTEFQAVAKNESSLMPSFAYMHADTVVKQALAAAERGRVVHVNGAINSVTAYAVRLLPRAIVRAFAGRIYRNAAGSAAANQ